MSDKHEDLSMQPQRSHKKPGVGLGDGSVGILLDVKAWQSSSIPGRGGLHGASGPLTSMHVLIRTHIQASIINQNFKLIEKNWE